MTSFDVTSLFTNIPVNETINIILDRFFITCDQYQSFTKKQFCEMLNLCTNYNIFVFEDKFYQQIDGALMCGCISPSLGDLFLSYYEEK